MAGIELEAAARRGEVGRLQRLLEGVLVGHAAGLLPGRENQVGGVVALARIERRQAAVRLLEGCAEGLVGRVVEVLRPLRGVLPAERGLAQRREDGMVAGESRAQ